MKLLKWVSLVSCATTHIVRVAVRVCKCLWCFGDHRWWMSMDQDQIVVDRNMYSLQWMNVCVKTRDGCAEEMRGRTPAWRCEALTSRVEISTSRPIARASISRHRSWQSGNQTHKPFALDVNNLIKYIWTSRDWTVFESWEGGFTNNQGTMPLSHLSSSH